LKNNYKHYLLYRFWNFVHIDRHAKINLLKLQNQLNQLHISYILPWDGIYFITWRPSALEGFQDDGVGVVNLIKFGHTTNEKAGLLTTVGVPAGRKTRFF